MRGRYHYIRIHLSAVWHVVIWKHLGSELIIGSSHRCVDGHRHFYLIRMDLPLTWQHKCASFGAVWPTLLLLVGGADMSHPMIINCHSHAKLNGRIGVVDVDTCPSCCLIGLA